jgi:hypothetical protein
MGLSFLHPAFLLGTLATAVPVVIHLIYRRRALVHHFPAVRFLLLADKRTARKFRLHQWLLLALRVLAILLLALVLARPHLIGEDVHAAATFPAQATIILVDNSLSMQYRDGQESRLQRAKAVAARLLQELRPQDSAAILPLLETHEGSDTISFLSHDRATLRKQLTAMSPGHAAAALVDTFQRAFTLLHNSPAPRRRIVLLSDFTIHGWEDFHLAQFSFVPERLELHFIRLGEAQRDANMLVEDVRIVETPFIEGVPLEVTALIRNRHAAAVQNLRVDLLVGQTKIGEQLVDLGPDEQVAVPFRLTAPSAGLHWGEVRLENDRFPEDDRWYFALRSVSPVRILAVDGDPGTSLFDSELFYLLSALQPAGALGRTLFYPKPVTWEGLEHERLSDYQVILLCNVEALAPQIRQRLHQFVVEGGGVLFFAGNRIEAARYNAMFSGTLLLPLALGQPIQHRQEQPMTIGGFEHTHEALSAFAADSTLLQRGKFYRYLAVQRQDSTPGVRVLVSFKDGYPLLVEKTLGRGRVMFFTSSADRDWTDLPTRTAYVPFLHGMLGYLANLSLATQRPETMMPEPVFLPGRQVDRNATVVLRTPDGQERLGRYATDSTQVVARFADYTVPGLYQATTPSGPDLLAVNATRVESNFEKLQAADLQTRFHPLQLMVEEENMLGQTITGSPLPIRELSGIFMLALVAVLIVENVCANRF